MIGSSILHYRITSELGRGGLGIVYQGEHQLIGRKAAIKVLNPAVASDEGMVARFLAEARAVNSLRHPNIIDVSEYGQANGVYYIVMELLEGETLAQHLDRHGPLEEARVVGVLYQVASAVAAAHDAGIVHRDLKPDNLFLTRYRDFADFVKVLDFGIAKLLGGLSTQRTAAGVLIGTPAFMSPEQCAGRQDLDHRSDIYSLGVVAFQLLTGRLPFQGDVMQMMQGHMLGEMPSLKELTPSVSDGLVDIVGRCVQREPAARYQSMREVRSALSTLGGKAPLAFSADELPGKAPAKAAPPPPRAAPAPTSRTLAEATAPTLARPAQSSAVATPMPRPMESSPSGRTSSIATPAPTSQQVFRSMSSAIRERGTSLSRITPRIDNRTAAQKVLDAHAGATEEERVVAVAARMREIIHARLQSDSLSLPAMPDAAVRCLTLAHDPLVDFASLAGAIEKDPFISSRVLRLANSPYYGGLARIASVEGAVARIGIETLVNLLRELAAEQVFVSKDPTIREAFRGIWEHCLGVAHVSRELANLLRSVDPNAAYLAGLFHDIGKPVVASALLESERGSGDKGSWLTGGTWRSVVNELHRDFGAIITLRWFLPREVATAVAELDGYDLKRGRASCANVVRLANALCQRAGLDVGAADPGEVDRTIVQGQQLLFLDDDQVYGLTAGLVQRIQAMTKEQDDGAGSTRITAPR